MSTISKVDEKTERWSFIFSYLIEKTARGYSAICEHDDVHLGTYDQKRQALNDASDDCSDRISTMHDCLLAIENCGRSLKGVLGDEHPQVLDRETEDRASELLEAWRERPKVPYAAPIDVAHMDDPAEFRREQDAKTVQLVDWAQTWVHQVENFLASVEEMTSCKQLGWKAPVFDVKIPEIEATIARWTRLRLVLETDRRIAYHLHHNGEGAETEKWRALLVDIVSRDADWWTEQREVRRPGRLPSAHQGGLA